MEIHAPTRLYDTPVVCLLNLSGNEYSDGMKMGISRRAIQIPRSPVRRSANGSKARAVVKSDTDYGMAVLSDLLVAKS